MKSVSLVIIFAFVALLTVACTETAPTTNNSAPTAAVSPAAPAAPVDQFAAARTIYQKNCDGCHGDNFEGGPVKVDNKQIKVPSLKSDHAMKHTDAQITKIITNGEESMPAFKAKLKPEEIAEMVRFVREVVQKK